MISFPKTLEQAGSAAAAGSAQVRAGGTDLQERRHLGLAAGDLVDLRDVPGIDALALDEAELHVGALVSISALAEDGRVRDSFPALAQAAGGLATPQIRNRATVGGNLLQEVRCWYYRNPHQACAKKGGVSCLARKGDHLYHAAWDLGPCVAPHPSTLALAFLVYDAQVELAGGERLSIPDLLGDGADPTRTHALRQGQVLTAVHVPFLEPGEAGAYGRAIARARAEWPLAEVAVRLVVGRKGIVEDARVGLGGVANRPFELPRVAEALVGQEPTDEVLAAASLLAAEGAAPLPMTAYKVKLVPGIVRAVLTQARDAALPPQPPAP